MTGNRAEILIPEKKSLVAMCHKGGKMLDFQGICSFIGLFDAKGVENKPHIVLL